MKDKKGMGIRDMYTAILMLLLVGVLLGVGIYTLTGVRTGIQTERDGFLNNTNVSSVALPGGVTYLNASVAGLYIDTSKVTVAWSNGTGAVTNFSVGTGGDITWGGDVVASDAGMVNVTYKHKWDEENPSKALTTAATGTDDFADWIAIIVVVIAAAIILGVVIKSFGGRKPGV